MNNMEKYNMIDRYLEGDLTEKEMQQFDDLVQSDTEFADAWSMEQDILEGIEAFGNEQLKAELQAIHEEERGTFKKKAEVKAEAKVVRMRRFRGLAMAASFALVLLAGWWIVNSSGPSDQIAADFYEKPSYTGLRSGEGEADIEKIKGYYESAAYQKAVSELELYLEGQKQNPDGLYYLGICHYELGNYEAASIAFQNLQGLDNEYNDKATWLLALSYVNLDKKEKAKAELQKLKDGTVLATNVLKDKVEALLEKLK